MSPPDEPNDPDGDAGDSGDDAGGPDEAAPSTEAGGEPTRRRRRRRRGRRGPDEVGAAGASDPNAPRAPQPPRQQQQPRGDHARGDHPRGDQPHGGQPHGGQPHGDPSGSDQPHGDQPHGDQPGSDQQQRSGQQPGGQPSNDQRGGQQGGGHRGGQRNDQRGGQQGGGPRNDQRGGQRGDQRGGQQGGGPRNDQRGGQQGGGPRNDQRGGPRNDQRGGQQGGGPRNDQRGGQGGDGSRRGEPQRGAQQGNRGRGGLSESRRRDGDREPEGSGQIEDLDDVPYARGVGDDIPYARAAQPEALRGAPASAEDDEIAPETPTVVWGTDDDAPAKPITLASDLPADAPADDFDPLTHGLADGPGAQLGDDVASVVGIRFVPAGRIQWYDAADADYAPGDRVLVDADRGTRLAWIATRPTRRATRDRGLRRVVRRANEQDLSGERSGDDDRARALRIAKDAAAALNLPLKVFRVELSGHLRGGKLNVYYTSDDRLDLRNFVRDVSRDTGARLELRQLGVRDEAKVVGGIGSCGLTLCCTTWMPEFVPVSIKMAKDQGLVLSPTKVAGQCGRLKCCLVYEQAGYAEMRKGLPKLGKRVIAPRGEGRVVEVDVLRQRVRVSYGPGDTEVLPATDVKPMFPPGNQPRNEPDNDPNDSDLPEEDPTASDV